MRRLYALFLIAVSGIVAVPGMAQQTMSIERPPETPSNLLQLANIIGSVHYLNVVCKGRSTQEWRERMVEMLELENPDFRFQGQLIAAFNQGYRDQEFRFPVCNDKIPGQIQNLSKKGRILSDALADPYLR